MNEGLYRNFELRQMNLMEVVQLQRKSWQELLREAELPPQKKKGFVRRNGR